MKGESIRDLIRSAPFTPFTIKTADNRAYSIDAPEFICMTRDLRSVLFQDSADDRTVWIDTANIVALPRGDRS